MALSAAMGAARVLIRETSKRSAVASKASARKGYAFAPFPGSRDECGMPAGARMMVRCSSSTGATSILTRVSTGAKESTKRVTSKVWEMQERLKRAKSAQQVAKLHLESFAQRHGRAVLWVGALLSGICIWQCTASVWSYLSSTSSHMSVNFGSLGVTCLLVGAVYAALYRRFGIDAESVHRLALLQLNTHPGILDVMGAPVVAPKLKAVVHSGGGLRLAGWRPQIQPSRIRMTFPLLGTQRHGLVFLDAKKRKGKYVMKVLGVDVNVANDEEQRIYVCGDSTIFSKGGVLASLRDPLLKSRMAEPLDTLEDRTDDEEEERRREAEREQKRQEKVESSPKGLDEGGGMYLYERIYWNLRMLGNRVSRWRQTSGNP